MAAPEPPPYLEFHDPATGRVTAQLHEDRILFIRGGHYEALLKLPGATREPGGVSFPLTDITTALAAAAAVKT
jgi:hypothetical protein